MTGVAPARLSALRPGDSFDPAELTGMEAAAVLGAVERMPELSSGAKRVYRALFLMARGEWTPIAAAPSFTSKTGRGRP